MALEKTTGYNTGEELAQEMMESLKGTSYDVSKPIPFTFYLYVPDEQSATTCANKLMSDGHEVEVEEAATNDGRWLCLCHSSITLPDGTVAQLGNRLIELAGEYAGEFDGWETNPYRNPGALEDLFKIIAEAQKNG